VLFAALFLLRYWQLFVKEEKILQESFGQQYSAYKKSVPRIFRIRNLFLKEIFAITCL